MNMIENENAIIKYRISIDRDHRKHRKYLKTEIGDCIKSQDRYNKGKTVNVRFYQRGNIKHVCRGYAV